MNTNDELMLSSPENMRQRYSIDGKEKVKPHGRSVQSLLGNLSVAAFAADAIRQDPQLHSEIIQYAKMSRS